MERYETTEKKHILVVDDDARILHLMHSYLQDGYKVSCVASGKDALIFLNKHQPDAILLDYMMPECDGPTTLEIIRSQEALKDIPVIFLTGVSDKERVLECMALRPQGYLVKPVEKKLLLGRLREVLG